MNRKLTKKEKFTYYIAKQTLRFLSDWDTFFFRKWVLYQHRKIKTVENITWGGVESDRYSTISRSKFCVNWFFLLPIHPDNKDSEIESLLDSECVTKNWKITYRKLLCLSDWRPQTAKIKKAFHIVNNINDLLYILLRLCLYYPYTHYYIETGYKEKDHKYSSNLKPLRHRFNIEDNVIVTGSELKTLFNKPKWFDQVFINYSVFTDDEYRVSHKDKRTRIQANDEIQELRLWNSIE